MQHRSNSHGAPAAPYALAPTRRRPGSPHRLGRGLACLALLCGGLGAGTAGAAPAGAADSRPGRLLSWSPGNGAPTFNIEALPAGRSGRGPLRGMMDAGAAGPRHFRGPGLYAHVDLASLFPQRAAGWIGRLDAGVTVAVRPQADIKALASQSLGSMLRWQAPGGGQLSLSLQGKQFGVQYGKKFY